MRKTPVQTASAIFGGVFVLVGILGFVPGITTDYDKLEFAGHTSGALLLGIFAVSILHNVVHLLFGAWGLTSSKSASASKGFLIVGGVVYLVLWLYGLFVHTGADANFVPVNGADNWLHFLLGVVLLLTGAILGRGSAAVVGDKQVTDGEGTV